MLRLREASVALLFGGLLVVSPACLPTDTRTPPGSLYTSVQSSDMTRDGIEASATADGWSITFQRVLVGIGRVNLGDHNSSCTRYSNRGYMRLLDMQVAGQQKLNIAYALGQCSVSFRVAYPGSESALGQGVSEADRVFMDTPKLDGYADPTRPGIAVYVKGTATRAGSVKHFAWAFRRRISYTGCGNDATDAGVRGLALESHDAFKENIVIHAETLFQDRLDPVTAKLHFQPYADADSVTGNDDGVITLDELGKVRAADAGIQDLASSGLGGVGGFGADAGSFDASAGLGGADAAGPGADGGLASVTLEDYIYLRLVPAMTRYKDIAGACTTGDVPSGRF